MYSINLSKLVTSPYFLQFLEQENIVFDTILTDNPFLAKEGKIQVFDQYLETFFAQQKIQET